MTEVAVTDRLANGLARHAIRRWREQVRNVARHVETVDARRPTTGKGLRRLVREMRGAYQPNSFETFVLETKKGCVLSCVVPGIETLDGVHHLAVEQADWLFELRGRARGHERLLTVHPHALARVFLRLQTVEFARVREELESTLIAWRAMRHVCERLKLAQLLVPTKSGVFRCDVRPDARQSILPVAKTWISFATVGQRDWQVVDEITQAVMAWRAAASEKDLAKAFTRIGGVPPASMTDALANALERHAWLRSPYTERRDHLSEMWDAAREQCATHA